MTLDPTTEGDASRLPTAASGRAASLVGAVAATAGALGTGAIVPLLPPRLRFPANAAAAAATIAVARWSGVTRGELGTGRGSARRGAAYGLTAALAAAGVVTAAAAHPRARALFADARVTEVSPARAAFDVGLRIPVATALVEETLFRGAVLGAWGRVVGPEVGAAISSVAFGLWHVIPALESHTHNPAGARISSRAGGRPAHIVGTVAATAVVGVAFAVLRLRARSLLAPVIAHAATNQLAYLAARWAHRARERPGS